MTGDAIKRWECPKCGAWSWTKRKYHRTVSGCPGVPVERVYVAVDATITEVAVQRAAAAWREKWWADMSDGDKLRFAWAKNAETPQQIENCRVAIRAAIAAVTEQTCPCRDDHTSWCPTHNVDGTPK